MTQDDHETLAALNEKLDRSALDKVEAHEASIDPSYEPTCEDWLNAAESVLREIRDNTDIRDPHFRHWAHVTILSYFAAKGEIPV